MTTLPKMAREIAHFVRAVCNLTLIAPTRTRRVVALADCASFVAISD